MFQTALCAVPWSVDLPRTDFPIVMVSRGSETLAPLGSRARQRRGAPCVVCTFLLALAGHLETVREWGMLASFINPVGKCLDCTSPQTSVMLCENILSVHMCHTHIGSRRILWLFILSCSSLGAGECHNCPYSLTLAR